MALMTTERERLAECSPYTCPVCSEDHARYARDGYPVEDEDRIYRAAHCCLWKTHDHATRERIAQCVEMGESWADAIEGEAR